MFIDESEALTHPYLARCWARRGTELRIQAPGQAKKQAMLGAFAWRFNRRFVLKTIHERLAIAAAATPPMPYRLLKLAEARW